MCVKLLWQNNITLQVGAFLGPYETRATSPVSFQFNSFQERNRYKKKMFTVYSDR